MSLYDLLWLEEPNNPRMTYHHNALALLVFVFGIVPAFGGFGYAALAIGPEWLRLVWIVPGVIIWSAVLIYVLTMMRHRSESVKPVYGDLPYAAPLFIDQECCTHEYPDGSRFCIYCGLDRMPAAAPTIKL